MKRRGAAKEPAPLLLDLGDLDPVSRDMVIGIVDALEKQAWMLRARAR